MQFIRIFHPVGQGAFYTEQHFIDGKIFTVVYDCGSLPGPTLKFKRKVASSLPPGTVINLLFISHFHEDHTNGLEELMKHFTIQTVVLPELTDEARVLLKIENFLKFNGLNTQIIDNPQAFFGAKTTIIEIAPIDGESDTGRELGDNSPHLDISEDGLRDVPFSGALTSRGSRSYPSGVRINLTAITVFWEYIPFNYEFKVQQKAFLVALGKEGLALAKLKSLDDIQANKASLIKAYNIIDGDLNENSLVVYSGSKDQNLTLRNSQSARIYYWRGDKVFRYHRDGCLYLGDISLIKGTVVPSLETRLVDQLDNVGCMQVPHHGSVKNFSPKLTKAGMVSVISFGTTNSYGHPSAHVIGQLYGHGSRPVLVTEEIETGFYAWSTQ